MKLEEIINCPLGTKVFRIQEGVIAAFETLGFHPKYPTYFYFCGNGSVTNVICYFIERKIKPEEWEIDYEKAKEIMWEQLQRKVHAINAIYMNDKKLVKFD